MTRRITLYSKPGCHLCEDVLAELQRLALHFDIAITEVDIAFDDDLLGRYQYLIPVVDIEDGVVLYAPITVQQLRLALEQVQDLE